jgi:O-antigen/teichoic acid export membrane protein
MMERLAKTSLKTDFLWVLCGNLLYSACQWGIVVALAKLGTPDQVGQYALGLAVSAPIVLFANFQLRALLASDVNDQFTFGQYLSFRFVSLLVALVLVAILAVFTQPDARRAGMIVLVGFAQALEFISDAYYGFMQKQERMDRLSGSLMMKGPLSLSILCLAMYVTHSALWAVMGLVVGRLLILLLWDSRLDFAGRKPVDAVRLEWDRRQMFAFLRTAAPLGIISMLVSLNSSIPRYFVEGHRGSAELGIFSAIMSLLSTGSLVVSAFGQSIFLPVARACAAFDRAKYRGYVALAVLLGGLLGGVAVVAAQLFGRTILTHVFRPEYGQHADILVPLTIAGMIAFIASGLGFIITAARSLRPQIPLLVITALAAGVTSAWAIPRHGLSGAAEAAMVAALVQLAGTGVILWKIDRQLQREAPPMVLDELTSPQLEEV